MRRAFLRFVTLTQPRARSPICGATPATCAHSTRHRRSPTNRSRNASRLQVAQIIQNARSQGRTLLTELESKHLLSLYGIPTVETRAAATEDEATTIASEIGFPVVLKVLSETITHKTDVGGVKLNLQDEAAVRSAYRDIQSSVAEKVAPINSPA